MIGSRSVLSIADTHDPAPQQPSEDDGEPCVRLGERREEKRRGEERGEERSERSERSERRGEKRRGEERRRVQTALSVVIIGAEVCRRNGDGRCRERRELAPNIQHRPEPPCEVARPSSPRVSLRTPHCTHTNTSARLAHRRCRATRAHDARIPCDWRGARRAQRPAPTSDSPERD